MLFVIASWASLLTAIVCATMPAGLPASRSVGSAFDPSTTIVVLRSKSPVEAKSAVVRADDGDDSDSSTGLPHVVGQIPSGITVAGPVVPAAFIAGIAPVLIEHRIDSTLLARPPPLS